MQTVKSPTPQSIKPASSWVIVVGAMFGAITLIGFFILAFLAGTSDQQFICRSFQLLAAVFALGAALSAAFLGGGAAAHGSSTGPLSFAFGVGGGVAVLVIVLVVFSYFRPECTSKQFDVSSINDLHERVAAMATTLDQAGKFAQAAGDNFSDSRTCSQHGLRAKGLILVAEASRRETEDDLRQLILKLGFGKSE